MEFNIKFKVWNISSLWIVNEYCGSKNTRKKDWLYSLALFWLTKYSSEAERLYFGGWKVGRWWSMTTQPVSSPRGAILQFQKASFWVDTAHRLKVLTSDCNFVWIRKSALFSGCLQPWDREPSLAMEHVKPLLCPFDQLPLCSEQFGQ